MFDSDIYLDGNVVGIAKISEEGLYYSVECTCDLPRNTIFKVYAVTSCETLNIGVCTPCGEKLRTVRKIPVTRWGNVVPQFYVLPKDECDRELIELLPNSPVTCVENLRQCRLIWENGKSVLVKGLTSQQNR